MSRRTFTFTFSLYFLLVLTLGQWPQEVSSLTPEQRALVDEAANLYMEQNFIPGLGLTIVENNGANTLAIGYGQSRLDTGAPVTSQTHFPIASISKSVTGLIISKVLHELFPEMGEEVLETPIAQLAPSFNFTFSDRFRSESVSFRDLISHRTCLANQGIDLNFGMSSQQEYIYRTRYEPEACGFRTKGIYNNNLYALAGVIVADLAGVPVHQLYNDFFSQLGMSATRLLDSSGSHEQLPTMPYAYYRVNNETRQFNTTHFRRWANILGGGGILSTATDMAQYIRFHLNRGRVGNTQVVPEEIFDWNYKPAIPNVYSATNTFSVFTHPGAYGYAMGLIVANYEGTPWIGHAGYLPPYESSFSVFPEKEFGLFVTKNGPGLTGLRPGQLDRDAFELLIFDIVHGNLTNLTNTDFNKHKSHQLPFADLGPGVPPHPSSATLYSSLSRKTQSSYQHRKRARAEPEEIVGVYGSPADGECTIALESDNQTISINFGSWGLGTLRRTSDVLFEIDWISDVNADYHAGGVNEVPPFLLDFTVLDQFELSFGGSRLGLFRKDSVLDNLPATPWEPDSCGPVGGNELKRF